MKRRLSIEIVSRDRCGLCAQAAREGAPQARQVADPFHLVQNLKLAIEEQLNLHGRATGRALLPDESISAVDQDIAEHERHAGAQHRRRARLAHHQSRRSIFETVHALSKQGLSRSEIGHRTGYGPRSIAKWLTFETPPDRRRVTLKPTSPLHFEAFLVQCWKDGNRCGRHLFHEVKRRGYTGSFPSLERLLASWKRRPEGADRDSQAALVNCLHFQNPARFVIQQTVI